MVDLAPPRIVQSPREYLSSHQIDLVRRLVQFGPAAKVRGGWMLGGNYHRDKTLKPLIALNLAAPAFRYGKHRLEARHTARALVEGLAVGLGQSQERPTPQHARSSPG